MPIRGETLPYQDKRNSQVLHQDGMTKYRYKKGQTKQITAFIMPVLSDVAFFSTAPGFAFLLAAKRR
jgi:hypothetical protein